MKNAIGIVAEYNPFHNGHALHLAGARRLVGENAPAVAVMSGSFMQRGEPAFADKWLRAACAVNFGVDVVFELPTVFSCRSAEFFAAGAVQLLAATGVVKYLAFGAETADAETLTQATAYINAHQNELRGIIKSGSSYAAAQTQLLADAGIKFDANQSNDILALEYCRALQKYAPDIKPLVIRRQGAGYNDNDIESSTASASAIRTEYAANGLTGKILQQLPPQTHELLQQAAEENALGYDAAVLSALVLYRLQMLAPAQIAAACECSEGLENRLKDLANASGIEQIINDAATKRYTKSRIRRLLMQLLLDADKTIFTQAEPQYLRLLAFNNRGTELLGDMRKNTALPVITKLGRNLKNCLTGDAERDSKIVQQLELDVKAANICGLLRHNHKNLYNSDFTSSPIYIPQ